MESNRSFYGSFFYQNPDHSRVAMAGFRLGNDSFVTIFHSEEQGRELLGRFDVCLDPIERKNFEEAIADRACTPLTSSVPMTIVAESAARTLCQAWEHYMAVSENQRHAIDQIYALGQPRVISYLSPATFVPNLKGPKASIILLRDEMGAFHVYITYSDKEATKVFKTYRSIHSGPSWYRDIMKRMPHTPGCKRPTIHITGALAGLLCKFIEVPRMVGLTKPGT